MVWIEVVAGCTLAVVVAAVVDWEGCCILTGGGGAIRLVVSVNGRNTGSSPSGDDDDDDDDDAKPVDVRSFLLSSVSILVLPLPSSLDAVSVAGEARGRSGGGRIVAFSLSPVTETGGTVSVVVLSMLESLFETSVCCASRIGSTVSFSCNDGDLI